MPKQLTLVLTLFLSLNIFSVSAFEAANPYWIAIKSKLKPYLEKNIDSSKYQYKILGPSRNLTNFLGNRPGMEIRFSALNLTLPTMRKTVIASAYDESGKKLASLPINLELKIYKKILTLKRAVKAGDEITPDNITQKVIAIDPRDSKIYYDGSLAQKVAGNNMPAGAAIKINQVRHEKLIQVGDSIKVTNKSKMIVLEFMCRAMKSGDINDVITVHCPDLQHKSKKAKIIRNGEAELI